MMLNLLKLLIFSSPFFPLHHFASKLFGTISSFSHIIVITMYEMCGDHHLIWGLLRVELRAGSRQIILGSLLSPLSDVPCDFVSRIFYKQSSGVTHQNTWGWGAPCRFCDSFNMMWENNKVAQMNMINGEHDDVGNDEVDQMNMIKGEYNDVGK